MFSHIKELFTRPSGYTIARSVRLRSSASAYFNRTPASASNRKTYTFSCWAKRGSLSSNQNIVAQGNNEVLFRFNTTDNINFADYTGGSAVWEITSSSVYRDPSAWYHIVFAIDTTQATSSNRVKVWINNSQVTFTGTYPTLNSDTPFNTTNAMLIGNRTGVSQYFDGYLTEINFIDGQALTPSSFGTTNATTGVWQPKKYAGTYGTNGFYLNFSDNSSNTATTIGKDYSGNGNNWTPNNISVTAGVTYDSMQDVPTLTSATAANFCVMNPLNLPKGGTLSNGNLLWTSPTAEGQAVGTMYVSSGKFYWEMVLNTAGAGCAFGIASITTDINNINLTAGSYVYYTNGNKYNGGTGSAYGATFTNGDIIGVALDLDAGTLVFYKNNTSQGTAFTGLSGTFTALIYDGTSASAPTYNANFGQQPFTYTPPSGYVALNTYNLPASTITNGAAYMAATTYTGNGTSQTITNAGGFAPDLVWIKGRSYVDGHTLFDTVRGATQSLSSNTTTAEVTRTTALTAFTSTGFTVSSDTLVNYNANTLVGWQWKAGGTSSSNTNGTITSTVSAGATQGFSVVTYTGTGANATVGHGLGVAPSMIIVKQRGTGGTDWNVYHISTGNTGAMFLDLTNAFAADSTRWNNTSPTSTVFTLGSGGGVNASSGTFVAYCFAAVAGYSSAFSYTGNGSSDGPFVYLGFRPRWIMVKKSSGVSHWQVLDSSRSPYNLAGEDLLPNASDAEKTIANGFNQVDMLSNGFKIRNTNCNDSGGTYIGFAIAENPFKLSLAR